MTGALFNILIPTKQHELHLSQQIACDCSIKTKQPNDNTFNKRSLNHPKLNLSITMEKVSTYLNINYFTCYMQHACTIYFIYIYKIRKRYYILYK